MTSCLSCGSAAVHRLADFGPQPVGHHFFDGGETEGWHPMVLGQCDTCGLAQLIDPIPPQRLVPRVDWISYNEPEAHLDRMVEDLARLPGIGPDAVIAGLTYKEDTTLRRFRERGFPKTWRADASIDLGIEDRRAGIERVQQRMAPPLGRRIAEARGRADLFLVRHVLEHTHDTGTFLSGLRALVKPAGYLVFEIPECTRGFDLLDYTVFWEDHSLYFVESTFRSTLERHGLEVVAFHRYPAPYENCLVAVTRPATSPRPAGPSPESLAVERARVRRFVEGFPGRREAIRRLLDDWNRQGGVALFGAGHQSSTFLNLLGVGDRIACVIDDDPRKAGLRMPGCRLPIIDSRRALESGFRHWLSSLGVESERRVAARHAGFIAGGGTFASIYPVTPDEIVHRIAAPNPAA